MRAAVAENPFMVAGTDRFDTVLMTAPGARVFAKGGAEGVHCAALLRPELRNWNGVVIGALRPAGPLAI
jgi:L-asparaginase II